MLEIPYILIGIIAGIIAGLFGVGGGIIIVPFALALGISSHHAIAISIVQMIFSSLFGSYLNYKKGNLAVKDGLITGFGGLIGASFSGIVVSFFSDIALSCVYLCVSIIFFLKYFFGTKNIIIERKRSPLEKNIILITSGAVVGVFAISLGIGGGLQLAAILGFFLGYDSKKVTRLSLFYIIFASSAGAFSFAREGIIDESIIYKGVTVALGSIFGVFVGTKIMEKIQLKSHRIALTCIYGISILITSFTLIKKILIAV